MKMFFETSNFQLRGEVVPRFPTETSRRDPMVKATKSHFAGANNHYTPRSLTFNIAPNKLPSQKESRNFQPSIFRGELLNFRWENAHTNLDATRSYNSFFFR